MRSTPRAINCVAFDCSNSSIRTVLGQYDGADLRMGVVHQAENQPIDVNDLFYWDILYVFNEMRKGLQKAHRECGHIDSVGVCTWGVDFGLLDKSGYLLANPLSYRNTLGQEVLSGLTSEEREFNFYQSGIQNSRINSLYQLLAIKKLFPGLFALANDLLLIPDLLVYMFTGEKRTEYTIASTTQMVDVSSRGFSKEILDYYQVPADLFNPMVAHGERYGYLRNSLVDVLGVNRAPFVCVASHDTASAVAAIPVVDDEDFLFVSSGTWSLIGTELPTPIISEQVYRLDFANEGGVFGTTTLLKNSVGLHIIQAVRRELAREGRNYTWDEIVEMAQGYSSDVPLLNPNDDSFFNPRSMIRSIEDYYRRTGQQGNQSIPALTRSIYESLAHSYRCVFDQISQITGKTYTTIHIVGGGSKNRFLNQLTADITGKTVLAGPVEATSLGNLGVQLRYHDQTFDLKKIRATIARSVQVEKFVPRPCHHVNQKLSLFKRLVSEVAD